MLKTVLIKLRYLNLKMGYYEGCFKISGLDRDILEENIKGTWEQ